MDINNILSSSKTIGLTGFIVIFVISVQLASAQPVGAQPVGTQATCGRNMMFDRATNGCVRVPNGFEPCPSNTVYDSTTQLCYSTTLQNVNNSGNSEGHTTSNGKDNTVAQPSEQSSGDNQTKK